MLSTLRAQVQVDIRTGRAVAATAGAREDSTAAPPEHEAAGASESRVVSVTGPMDRFVPRMRGQTAAAGPGVAPAGAAVAASREGAPRGGGGGGGGGGQGTARRGAGSGFVPGLETHAAPLRAMAEADAEDGTGGRTPHRAGAGPAGGGAAAVPTAESAVGLGARVAVAAACALHRTASGAGPRTQGTAEQRASLVSVGELASASDLTAALLSRRVGVALPDRAAAVLGDRVMQHLLALAPRREALARLSQTLPLLLEEAFFPMDAPESAPPAAPSRRPAAHSSAADCWAQRVESEAADVRAATHAARGVPEPVRRIAPGAGGGGGDEEGEDASTSAAQSGRGRGRGRKRGPDLALRAARREEVMGALLSAASFLHELPLAAEGLVIRLLRSWDGESHAEALFTLVSWLRPRAWDEMYAEVARPLAAAVAAARPLRQATALIALARLTEHWASAPWGDAAGPQWRSAEDWMLASPDARADRYRALQELCAFANRVAQLALACSKDHPAVQHAAARIADASAHATVSHGLPLVLAPSPFVLYRLLLARNAFAVSCACSALVHFRAAFTQARSVAESDPDALGRSSATEYVLPSTLWDGIGSVGRRGGGGAITVPPRPPRRRRRRPLLPPPFPSLPGCLSRRRTAETRNAPTTLTVPPTLRPAAPSTLVCSIPSPGTPRRSSGGTSRCPKPTGRRGACCSTFHRASPTVQRRTEPRDH